MDKRKGKGRSKEIGERESVKGVWDERGREEFRKQLGRIEEGEKGIQEEIEEIGKRIRKTMEGCEGKRGVERGNRKGWWDEECKERKN